MRVLAIDPGNLESAYVIWERHKIHAFGKVLNAEMRGALRQFLQDEPGADRVVALEIVASYGMTVGKEVFETCVAVGRYTQVCEQFGLTPQLVYRLDEKLHHCRSVKANDATINRALKDRFGDKGTSKRPGFFFGFKDDVWQAMAIAVLVTDRAAGLQTAPISKINVN